MSVFAENAALAMAHTRRALSHPPTPITHRRIVLEIFDDDRHPLNLVSLLDGLRSAGYRATAINRPRFGAALHLIIGRPGANTPPPVQGPLGLVAADGPRVGSLT